MNRYILIRRLRWPAILLLAGVIALLHQMGAIAHFWHLFIPLLLIMLGLLLLAERMALSAEDASTPYPGGPYPGAPYAGVPYGAQPAAPQAQPTTSTSIVPAHSNDYENDPHGGQS
jgi:hypothetical protein